MLTSQEVLNSLLKMGIRKESITMMDDKYSIPTQDWILKASPEISFQLKDMFGIWKEESFDCDDFALATTSLMRLAHAANKTKTSLPVGYFRYIDNSMGKHAINIAFVNNGIMFFEPQTGKHKILTETEIKSCSRLLI